MPQEKVQLHVYHVIRLLSIQVKICQRIDFLYSVLNQTKEQQNAYQDQNVDRNIIEKYSLAVTYPTRQIHFSLHKHQTISKMIQAKIIYEPIQPKICIGDDPPLEKESIPCGTCNPFVFTLLTILLRQRIFALFFITSGMYKNNNKCEFCPAKTYSNGTSSECLPCVNELSLLPGLYYHNWNELPKYLNRSYMSFDDPEICMSFVFSSSL